MNKLLSDNYFNRLRKDNIREKESLKKYSKVNNYLKSNDWLFISPLFFQGFELSTFLKLSNSKDNNKEKILKVIANKFYDLGHTVSFTEGYCNRCDYTKPFLKSIETSLILTFQKDYEGSIKTLIPIIEGALRQYLIKTKDYTTETIRMKDLKNSLDTLKEDIILNCKVNLENYKDENKNPINFSEEQVAELLDDEKDYYNIWFSFADDFIKNSFYLNTKGQNLTNEINRHSILHEFGLEFEYNFENFIKVYFLLQFLVWGFLRTENKSILNEIGGYRYFEKIVAYERIIKYSKKLMYEKHLLLKNYGDYDEDILKQEFPKFSNKILSKKHLIIHKFFRNFDYFLWKNNFKNKKPYS
jgi:hypothetical protein